MQTETVAASRETSSLECELISAIEREVGPRNYQHWFADNIRLKVCGEELSVGVKSPFVATWMQKNFRPAVSAATQAVLGPAARVSFHVTDSSTQEEDKPVVQTAVEPSKAAAEQTPTAPNPPAARKASRRAVQSRRLARLEDFVGGEANALALAAARAVGEQPATKFNPLFLYGGSGVGKTHLLEGIFRELRRYELKVALIRAETFVNYFTSAIRSGGMPAFRQKFRNIDALLVDEVDFLDGKQRTQEEFLSTFKQLESQGAQIVLTCDRHPRLLSKLGDELVTRFLSGLVCRIEPPDFETRKCIARRKAAGLKADFSDDVLDFVARRFKNNVRELEGALNCLDTYRSVLGKRLSPAVARRVLSELERDCIRIVRLTDVENVVCRFFGLEPEALKSSSRHRSVSQPRMLAMFLARKHTQAAYSEIGKHFGGRNHSTVMSAEKKVHGWLRDESSIRVAANSWPLGEIVSALEEQLLAG